MPLKELTQIAGQRAIITHAQKVLCPAFKVSGRAMLLDVKVTLRHQRMYEFSQPINQRCFFPQIRDFPRGFPQMLFDGRGNYSLGPNRTTHFS